jgi:hypothetical protein
VVMVIDRDAGVVRGYLDGSNEPFVAGGGGAPDDILPASSIATGLPLVMGAREAGTSGSEFRGLVDDVGIWRRALTSEEVQAIYQAGLEGRDLRDRLPLFAFRDVVPAIGSHLYDASEGLHFTVESRNGIDPEGIRLFLNGVDRSADLAIGGTTENRTVSFTDLAVNQHYEAMIEVTDAEGIQDTMVIHFDTISEDLMIDGLVAHWSLDEMDIENGQVLVSEGLPAYHGTIIGTLEQMPGLIDGALSFSGVSGDYVNFGNVLDPGEDSFSVAFWFKQPEAPSHNPFLMTKGNRGSGDVGWTIYTRVQGNLQVRAYDGSGSANRAGQTTADGVVTTGWHHAAMVIDREAGVIRGYFDGTNEGFTAGGGGSQTDVLQFGTSIISTDDLKLGDRAGLGAPFRGLIDDVGVWRRALTGEEVLAIYQAGLQGQDLRGRTTFVGPLITDVSLADGQIVFSFPTVAGQNYHVESTSALGPNADWIEVELIEGDGDDAQVAYPTTSAAAYYRVKIASE